MNRNLYFFGAALLLLLTFCAGCSSVAPDFTTDSLQTVAPAPSAVSVDSPTVASSPSSEASVQLSAGEALDTALFLAGISDFSGVILDKFKLENGIYEIRFKSSQGEYQYDISSVIGEILKQEISEQTPKTEQAADGSSTWLPLPWRPRRSRWTMPALPAPRLHTFTLIFDISMAFPTPIRWNSACEAPTTGTQSNSVPAKF